MCLVETYKTCILKAMDIIGHTIDDIIKLKILSLIGCCQGGIRKKKIHLNPNQRFIQYKSIEL